MGADSDNCDEVTKKCEQILGTNLPNRGDQRASLEAKAQTVLEFARHVAEEEQKLVNTDTMADTLPPPCGSEPSRPDGRPLPPELSPGVCPRDAPKHTAARGRTAARSYERAAATLPDEESVPATAATND